MAGLPYVALSASRLVGFRLLGRSQRNRWVGQGYVRIHLIFLIFVLCSCALIRNVTLFPRSGCIAELPVSDKPLEDFVVSPTETLD
jgi:hypothetical protein